MGRLWTKLKKFVNQEPDVPVVIEQEEQHRDVIFDIPPVKIKKRSKKRESVKKAITNKKSRKTKYDE